MIESMACGTPVIATRWGAVPEVIEDGRDGDHRRRLARRSADALEAADALDPAAMRRDGRGALHAGADGGRLRRRVRGRHRCEVRLRVAVRPRDPRGSPCRRSARSPPSRSTSSSTRRSSATSAGRSSRRSGSPRPSSPGSSRSSTSSSTGRRRRSGARPARARSGRDRLGAQALWLSLGFGLALAAGVAALAPQIVELMGGEGETADYAVTYMRIAALGLPFAFLALGGQGYLRGVADLRTPLVIVIAANVVERRARGAVRLRLRLGDRGLGVGDGDRAGRDGRGVHRRASSAPPRGDARPVARADAAAARVGRYIFVRTAALMAAFTLAGAVIARFGDASLAAHQIAFQLWIFLALVLDAIAIAGQVLVGRGLGAGDTERAYDGERADDLALGLRRVCLAP